MGFGSKSETRGKIFSGREGVGIGRDFTVDRGLDKKFRVRSVVKEVLKELGT